MDDALQVGEVLGEVDQLLDDADIRAACLLGGHSESVGPGAVVDLGDGRER